MTEIEGSLHHKPSGSAGSSNQKQLHLHASMASIANGKRRYREKRQVAVLPLRPLGVAAGESYRSLATIGTAEMYLKQAVIENSGSIRWLNLNLGFTEGGLPKPLILVGGNGSGKTNLISTVADALFEAAAASYRNVLPSQGLGRAWFRVVGGRTLTIGTSGGFSLLRFDDAGTNLFYRMKAGRVDQEAAAKNVPEGFADQLNWSDDGSAKDFQIKEERSRVIFEQGVYVYFPSSRSEVPYWLNRDAVPEFEFDMSPNVQGILRKKIYVERALEDFRQWITALIMDARVDVRAIAAEQGVNYTTNTDAAQIEMTHQALKLCNELLQALLSDPGASFAWWGRKSPDKVGVVHDGKIALANLDGLSSGQSILLGMFGTLLRYGDLSRSGPALDASSIEGICLIDEVDSHIHIDLQHNVLPRLIRLFPKIQFVLSSHSPIFVLGMEREFGSEGIQVVEMPGGVPVGAESYAEFERALEALAATRSFTGKVIAEARLSGNPVVFVEGETDAPYLKRAAKILGRSEVLTKCDIEWIGAKDERGQGFNTGKDALKHTLSVLRANPRLAKRRILLLFDNDVNIADQDFDGFSVRKLPVNPSNRKIKAGIENLLAEECIQDSSYHEDSTTKPNGDIVTKKTLRKSDLCHAICENGTADQFGGFDQALRIIEDFLALAN